MSMAHSLLLRGITVEPNCHRIWRLIRKEDVLGSLVAWEDDYLLDMFAGADDETMRHWCAERAVTLESVPDYWERLHNVRNILAVEVATRAVRKAERADEDVWPDSRFDNAGDEDWLYSPDSNDPHDVDGMGF